VQVLRLVPLAGEAAVNEVLHDLLHVRKVKITLEPVEGSLYAFMAFLVDGPENFRQ
jgi:hypothetical protein